MTTGTLPREHGVVANGFYWRDKHEVEMWTAWNDCIQRPQIWDMLHRARRGDHARPCGFALHSKGCGADYRLHARADSQSRRQRIAVVLHQADRDVRRAARHAGPFSAAAFLGAAGEHSSSSRVDLPTRPAWAAQQSQPDFFYIYLPHLDYAAQKSGPDSDAARQAVAELDDVLGRASGRRRARPTRRAAAVAGGQRVRDRAGRSRDVSQPRAARGGLAGRRRTRRTASSSTSRPAAAWALVDHQFSHVFVADRLAGRRAWPTCSAAARASPKCWSATSGASYELDHERSGEVVLVSDAQQLAGVLLVARRRAGPGIRPHGRHSPQAGLRPGGNALRHGHPVDPARRHAGQGLARAPARDERQRGVIVASQKGVLVGQAMADTDVCELVLRQFGI